MYPLIAAISLGACLLSESAVAPVDSIPPGGMASTRPPTGPASAPREPRRATSVDPTPLPALLVLSKAEQVLSIVDPSTYRTIARVPSGRDPHEVVASPDGTRAYVTNYGSGAYNTITVVDLIGQRTLSAVDLGPLRGPHGVSFATGKVWFTAEAAKAVGSFDAATNTVDWVLGTGQDRTHMLMVTGDGKRVVTTNTASGTVTIIDRRPVRASVVAGSVATRVEWDETVIPVGRGAEGFDMSPDGKEAWVANAQDGTISVIDLAARRVVQTLAADVRGANRLKITPDGTLAFVSTLSGANATVLRVATREVVKRIPVGTGAAGILVQPDGARVYVACTPDDDIAVIDVPSLTVVHRIAAGRRPDGLAWAARP
ncbi:MAG: hypothetical protein NVS1B4_25020 [Gemmatimonadaceae bacterium]